MLYRQRSTFFYETRIKPAEKTISPFRKRTSEPGRTQKTKYAAVSRIPSEVAVGRRIQGSVKRNVFVKPNEQSRACASYAMARKRLLKTNLFLSILFLLAASAAGAQEPPVTEAEIERQEQQRARETTEQRVEQAVEGELQELLERIPDSLRVDKWIPGTVVVDGHILEPVPLHKPEMERWSMPRQQQVTPIERDFVRRLTSGWLAVSNGQAFNWEYGRRIWGVGSIYPGSYLDARTLSFPLPR